NLIPETKKTPTQATILIPETKATKEQRSQTTNLIPETKKTPTQATILIPEAEATKERGTRWVRRDAALTTPPENLHARR
ncbi:hypothetical protein, partial [Gordonia sp. (in: high G+C Gram-positive bacteria)]|uniref:hypothetical protein n=1 Tax=Gordonia sp. (in: high G+C Gram-positive bacteria) TaxID=84139 RepID=UPI002FDA4048